MPSILYEDEVLVAFDKPAGLLVSPDRWDKARTNLMALIHERLSPEWFNVHRIDRDTSGVLLCTKNGDALRCVTRQFEERSVRKVYLALLRGTPQDPVGEISMPIDPDPSKPGRMRASAEGSPAATAYEVLESWRSHCLVQAVPRTGRTHQIRVHFAWLGCPVLADPLYSDGEGLYLSALKRGYKPTREVERPLIGRLALHAASLSLSHPADGRPVTIESPVPHDMALALKSLRRYGAGR